MRAQATRNPARRSVLLSVTVIAGVLLVIIANQGDNARCRPLIDEETAVNVQRRITATSEGVEVELWSSVPFPVRALAPVVRIGERDFTSSRHPDDGTLNTLIFLIPSEAFEQLTSDDPVVVYYGTLRATNATTVGTDGWSSWTFGTLRSGIRDCPEAPGGSR